MYTLAPAGVRLIADGSLIRKGDPSWPDYLAWVSAGGVPGEPQNPVIAPAPVRVPDVVGPGQMMVALEGLGLLDDAEAWVSAQARHIQLAWARASEFRRDSPLIAVGAAALAWDAELVDAIFIAAGLVVI